MKIPATAFWLIAMAAHAESFVSLSGPDGQTIFVNPHEITSIREPTVSGREHFARGVRCVVTMTNKNFIAVVNTCDEVRKLAGSVP